MDAISVQDKSKTAPDLAEIRSALTILFEPGQVIELRGLDVTHSNNGGYPTIASGYYNDLDKCTQDAANIAPTSKGVYVILNPFNPALLARASNRLRKMQKKDASTADSDILRRRWMLIDVDPKRPTDISSTDAEKEYSLEMAKTIRDVQKSLGWPAPILADSGNGTHLLYRIDLPADDNGIVENCLKALAASWDDDQAKIDQSVFNPARISKLYGTLARKGDDVLERPHRLTKILEVPEKIEIVSLDLLEELANSAPKEQQQSTGDSGSPVFDLEKWIAEHHLDVGAPEAWAGKGRRWIFNVCPWDSSHTDSSAYIGQFANGAIFAGCHHNHCAGKNWHGLRDLIEPGWGEKKDPYAGLDLSGIGNQVQPLAEPAKERPAGKTRWSVAELYDTQFPAPRWAIPGLIPEGVILLGGRPKVGKSWLALQIAHSVGSGGMFFGKNVEKGNVLYIALEDGPRRLQERIKKHKIPRDALIAFERDWPPLQKDGMTLLFNEIVQHEYRLVVIDTLTRAFRGLDQNDQPQINAVMSSVQHMATDHRLAIIFNDHTSKPKGDVSMGDPIDDIMNSTVKTAVADLVLALYKEQGKAGAALKGRGRDLEDVDLELKWDPITCCWQCEGQAGQIRMTEARQDVLDALKALGRVQVGAVAKAVGRERGHVFRILNDLYSSQKIRRESIGDNVYYESLP